MDESIRKLELSEEKLKEMVFRAAFNAISSIASTVDCFCERKSLENLTDYKDYFIMIIDESYKIRDLCCDIKEEIHFFSRSPMKFTSRHQITDSMIDRYKTSERGKAPLTSFMKDRMDNGSE